MSWIVRAGTNGMFESLERLKRVSTVNRNEGDTCVKGGETGCHRMSGEAGVGVSGLVGFSV